MEKKELFLRGLFQTVYLRRCLKDIWKQPERQKMFFHPCFRFWSTDDNAHKQLSCPQQIKLDSYLNILLLLVRTYFKHWFSYKSSKVTQMRARFASGFPWTTFEISPSWRSENQWASRFLVLDSVDVQVTVT